MGVSLNNILGDLLSETVSRIVQSGILNHLREEGIWRMYKRLENIVEDNRRIFSLSDLEFGFVLWLASCGVSIVVFFIELSSLIIKRWVKKLVGNIDS